MRRSSSLESRKALGSVGPLSSLLLVALCQLGCAGRIHPEDESARAHRLDAAREEQAAKRERKQYDPAAVAIITDHSPAPLPIDGALVYNPTDDHLAKAERDERHARQHRAAAQKLERFEQAECAALAADSRAACPLVGPIKRVEDIPGGVRVYFADGAPLNDIAAHMRCHLAFARVQGFADAADCPLYVKGETIKLVPSEGAIELVSSEVGSEHELRRLAHQTLVPVPNAPATL